MIRLWRILEIYGKSGCTGATLRSVGDKMLPTEYFFYSFFILFMYNVIKFYKTKAASQ